MKPCGKCDKSPGSLISCEDWWSCFRLRYFNSRLQESYNGNSPNKEVVLHFGQRNDNRCAFFGLGWSK